MQYNRDKEFVEKNLDINPILVDTQESSQEWIVGDTDLMYYQTRRIELKTGGKYEGKNDDKFTVLTLVDGEEALIYSKSHPEFYYEAKFLDIVTVPASVKDYVIEAKGYQPVVMHKTIVK